MSNEKFDLFECIKAISSSNVEYLHDLSEDELKKFQPFVIQRWLTGNTKYEHLMINHIVNRYTFAFGKHPKLLFNLMTLCTKKNSKYRWIKRGTQNKNHQLKKLLSEYLSLPLRHVNDFTLSLYSNDEILEICEQMGKQKDEIVKIKTYLKKRV